MRVLITGGAGFIGRWTVKKFLDKGHQVYIIDNFENSSEENISEFRDHENLKLVMVASITDDRALTELFSNKFDIILMDVNIPEIDGITATRLIREKNPKIPIIGMTAAALESDVHNCLEAGMNDYLSKPITPQRLYAMMSGWLPVNQGHGMAPLTEREGNCAGSDLGIPLPDFDVDGALNKSVGNKAKTDYLMDWNQLNEEIKQLADLLDQRRLDAADRFAEFKEIMPREYQKDEFYVLADAVRRLDYKNARKALDNWSKSLNRV